MYLYINVFLLYSFYGVIVADLSDNRPNPSLDLELQYPNPQPSSRSNTFYYIAAGWNNANNVPTTFKVGDRSVTTATRSGVTETYDNLRLSRQTSYCVLAIVYLDSGIPGVREKGERKRKALKKRERRERQRQREGERERWEGNTIIVWFLCLGAIDKIC